MFSGRFAGRRADPFTPTQHGASGSGRPHGYVTDDRFKFVKPRLEPTDRRTYCNGSDQLAVRAEDWCREGSRFRKGFAHADRHATFANPCNLVAESPSEVTVYGE